MSTQVVKIGVKDKKVILEHELNEEKLQALLYVSSLQVYAVEPEKFRNIITTIVLLRDDVQVMYDNILNTGLYEDKDFLVTYLIGDGSYRLKEDVRVSELKLSCLILWSSVFSKYDGVTEDDELLKVVDDILAVVVAGCDKRECDA